MRRFLIILLGSLALVASVATAGSFKLNDGSTIVGTPDTIVDKGVTFQLDGGDISARIDWSRFTPEALKELVAESKTDAQRGLAQTFVDNLPQEVAKRKEIVVTPIQTPERSRHGAGVFALFGSPVGWAIFIVLYAANLFAAYEVCVYRRQPLAMVCGLAAIPFLGVLSPIIYGAMPTQKPPPEPLPDVVPAEATAEAVAQAAAVEGGHASAPAAGSTGGGAGSYATAPTAPAANLPEPLLFPKGEYSFNRRFFETRFAGFFRLVPSESERDLVLLIKASRGQFVGRRIVRITPSELYLQVFKNEATADEMIPFTEISEVQIRHKDIPVTTS